ncbi:nucleoporin subcomplex protein binding to Pom34-domain-containing protein [Durotheca rogersii]|uniref:nucleoporin subcomplex protein binding to Pom34-domain-containing protein n=1 Tax=Durotheca rogersii TaxID=419775 RepID=UPI002220C300|nr:nucleoporin subcomplex protein binding to Pom34-domain-containing protein [Durotheca rogersii]KAI5860513.1 nucleoporin subcomplex protein binding to Pom34-domain-containing protein [Durotheca rogersii]
MAELLSDDIYLPPLEPCLKGETVVLSWKLVASALTDPSGRRQSSSAVIDYLTDPLVQSFFTKPGSAFDPPGGDRNPHHATFVKKTAAIEVTPTPNDKYDINVIKEDALWLSKVGRINEVAALRVVVVEFQSRPQSQLRGPISNQDVANLREAAGASNAQTTNILPGLSIASTRDATEIQADFEKPESRKRRIFQTYLDERRYYAATNDYIFTLMLHERLPTSPATDASSAIRRSFMEAYGINPRQPQKSSIDMPTRTFHALASQYLNLLPFSVQNSQTAIGAVVEDEALLTEELHEQWMQTWLTDALHRMVVVFQLLDLSSDAFVSEQLAQQWFTLVGAFSFLDQLQNFSANISDLAAPLQCLVCVISLTVLNLPRMMGFFEGDVELNTDDEYLASSNLLEQIHDVLESAISMNLAYTVPVLFAWVPVVHAMFSSYQERAERRDAIQNEKAVENYDSSTQMVPAGRRNSAGSITTIDKRRYDDFLINKNLDRDVARVRMLASVATDEAHVYDVIAAMSLCLGASDRAIFSPSVGSRMRTTFLDLLKTTYPFVGYKSEPVCALLAVLSGGQSYWDLSRPCNILAQQDILHIALNDEIILENYFQQALNRFPYEFVPFLTLCRTLYCSQHHTGEGNHERILGLLQKMPTLTFTLPDHFIDYQLANEEENSNGFQLLEPFPLFSVPSSRQRIATEEEPFTIPEGTYGRFIVDEGRIVRVEYEHSVLALLGKRLDANLTANKYLLELGELGTEETAEAIALFATLIRVECLKTPAAAGVPSEAGLAIVAEASRALPRTKDIISVVCDTLDVLLDGEPESQGQATIVSCLQFLHAVLPICPGRVWSYISRCTILSNQDQGGRLARLVGNLDLSSSQFELLVSAVRLFSSLIDSAVASSVRRKTGVKANARQKQNHDVWLGVSDKIVSQISLSIARAAMDILESSSTWRFASILDRMVLVRDVVPIMDKVTIYCFSVDDINAKDTRTFLMSALEPAAKYVVDSFLTPSAGSLRMQSLLVTLVVATQPFDSTVYANRTAAFRAQTVAVLRLAKSLVRVANYLDRPSTTVEHQLFKATPFVARVCACDDAFRGPAIELLEALVISAGKAVGEPPSLLGYLGPQISRSFLQLLSTLDRPFDQAGEVNTIWRFFSTIVRNRQQWMANSLLTGRTPRDAKNSSGKATEASSSSILASALERLTFISKIEESETLAILDFITSAQNFWPWTIFTLQKNTRFLEQLRSFVHDLPPSSLTSKSNVLRACNDARIAAYIAEIFAMQLFHLRQIDQADSFANELTRDLDYYLRDGVAVSGYNRGLHVNFARNFSNQYPGFTLDNFKRTLLEPRSLGADFYYALGFADEMLTFDPGWVGPRSNGFRSEMEKANINLSLVDAQISLYHAWEFLLLELSTCLPSNDTLKKHSLQVARQCLEANEETQNHDQVFERLAESRVNLALMLVQRVVNSAPSAGDITQLLTALWATISSIQEPYAPHNITLYRTLLKLLYVTLRAQVRSLTPNEHADVASEKHGGNAAAAAVSQIVLSIIDIAVAKGFRSLVSLIHDSQTLVLPSDVGLINAILQACLCIPGMDQSQTQILNILATHDAVQAAVSLYSWSDKLADQGDPIYGELSLIFLLELSTLPLVAEQLACDGLLNQITSANLAAYLRRPNVSPFADSVGSQRCYSIWAKGIVPLLLNILTALGVTIAPEVAYVLNQFPNLMRSSVERLEAPDEGRRRGRGERSYVTLLSVSEIHSLALMTRVLAALRANNARDVPEVAWDAAALLESVEFWIDRRKLLREKLVPLGPREAEWKSAPPSDRARARGGGGGAVESRLEEKLVEQLELVRVVLSEGVE